MTLVSMLILGACSSPAPLAGSTTNTAEVAASSAEPVPTAGAEGTEPVLPSTTPAPPSSSSAAGGSPTSASPTVGAPATTASPPPLPVGRGPAPTGLSIPSIDVDEQLIDLGIGDDGTAEVPADYARAGWFAGGGRPGGVGPTVILGHVDSLDGPAVFHRLRDVPVGADIDVQLADGTTAQYRVESTAQYAKADFPTFEVYGATPVDTLTLITCGGPFDTDALSYTENVVVTALRV